MPAKEKLSKWKEFAKQKGIQKTKKSRKVWDDRTQVCYLWSFISNSLIHKSAELMVIKFHRLLYSSLCVLSRNGDHAGAIKAPVVIKIGCWKSPKMLVKRIFRFVLYFVSGVYSVFQIVDSSFAKTLSVNATALFYYALSLVYVLML